MTMIAAEAGAGAVEGEAASAAGAGRSATGRHYPGRARPDRPAHYPGRARTGGSQRAGGRKAPPEDFSDYEPPRSRPQIAQTGPTKREFALEGAWPSANYQGAILGEFVLAVLLVAATPFAQKNRTGVSPYAGKDMIQLLAITVLYFLLAVLAGTSHGMARFSAWFGGLILLVVGLAEASNIASAVSKYLNPGTPAPAAAPAGNPSVMNAGSTVPPTGIARAPAQQPGTGLA